MAIRPVFSVEEKSPFYKTNTVSFEWINGYSKPQKQNNIQAMHSAYLTQNPEKKVLEISSKSLQKLGTKLSAFFLMKYVPSLGRKVSVECVFQAGKVFEKGGPYLDILEKTSKDAKRDPRLRNSGKLVAFEFEGKRYPLDPKTIFYDYIYINALLENPELSKMILDYDAFTDIEFNPERSINCQAKAAAEFVSLSRQGLIDHITNFDDFIKLYKSK